MKYSIKDYVKNNLVYLLKLNQLLALFLLSLLIISSCSANAQNVEPLIEQAETAENSQNGTEAVRIWQNIIQLQPNAAWAYTRLGSVLFIQGRYDEAIAVYRQAIENNPGGAENYHRLGDTLLFQQQLNEAISAYRQGIRLDSANVFTLDWFMAPPLEQVIETLHNEIQLHPENAAIDFLLLGSVLRTSRRRNEAVEFTRQNLPHLCQQFQEYGVCNSTDGRYPDLEISAFRQAIELDPQLLGAYEMLGISLYELQNYDAAVTAFQQAIALNPDNARIYYRLGDVLIAQAKSDEAVEAFYQAAQAGQQSGIDFQFWIFQAHHPRDQVITALQENLQNNPSAVGYYVLGNVLAGYHLPNTQSDDWEQAIAAFQQAIQLDANFAKAYERMGYIFALQAKPEEAERLFRQSIQIDPNLVSAYNNLRSVLRNQQKFDEAEQVFRDQQRISDEFSH